MNNPNHPCRGSIIRVEGLRDLRDVNNIKRLLSSKPRDLCIFTLGVNWGLRGSDLLRLTIGQVRYLKVGDTLRLREKKTNKERVICINKNAYGAIQGLLKSMTVDVNESDYLFQSRKGKGKLTIQTLNAMVKSWGREIKLKCNLGSHSLRKTFGTVNRLVYGTDLTTLTKVFGHSSQAQTMKYIGLTETEVLSTYMHEI